MSPAGFTSVSVVMCSRSLITGMRPSPGASCVATAALVSSVSMFNMSSLIYFNDFTSVIFHLPVLCRLVFLGGGGADGAASHAGTESNVSNVFPMLPPSR